MHPIISKALKRGSDLSICFDCARANGGKWPIVGKDKDGKDVGHAATCWVGECAVCSKEVSCCSLSDWDWPRRETKLEREI